ncbi:MAG: homoserine dehydrogenase [Anaerolineae bacterium]
MRDVRIVLIGLGNLGRRFCEVLLVKDELLRRRYELALRVVGAADSRGAAYDPAGLDLNEVVRLKSAGSTVADYPRRGRRDWDSPTLVANADADILLEASPVNLEQGAEPGLTCVRTALERGMHVATPNKGPLVVAFDELHDLAAAHGVQLRFDGTVAGGLPAINVGARDLRGAVIERLEGVLNLTTGYVMDLLADGASWNEARSRAREAGVLEGDGRWDLEGWDAAAKLLILANAVLGQHLRLADVPRVGVFDVDVAELRAAQERGERYRLLARADLQSKDTYAFSITPTALSATHPLGRLGSKQLGIVYTTDIYGTLTLVIDEPTPVPSAATMLRDLLDIYSVRPAEN